MSRSKTNMPKDIKKKCHAVIHAATGAATVIGIVPISGSDTIPITATQIGMIISLGKIFGITLSETTSKTIASVAITRQAGRTIFASIMKAFPITAVIGSVIGGTTAFFLTESLGWLVADDFYRMSNGEEPRNIIDAVDELKILFTRPW